MYDQRGHRSRSPPAEKYGIPPRTRSPPKFGRYGPPRRRSRSRSPVGGSRSPSPRRNRARNPEPSNILIVRGLPLDVMESDLWAACASTTFKPQDIRLLRRRDTGQSRGFAFVEFATVDKAVEWLQAIKGSLRLSDSVIADVLFSDHRPPPPRTREPEAFMGAKDKGDWLCAECGTNNFKKRDQCFKCNLAREESEQINTTREGYSEIGMMPCDTLLLRNIPKHVPEERVKNQVIRVAGLEPAKVHLARDDYGMSRGYAFVQMGTVQDAMQLLTTLTAITKMTIENKDVMVSYSRIPLSQMEAEQAAAAALATPSVHQDPSTSSLLATQADSANAAAAVAQDAMRKATVVKQVRQAVIQEQLQQAAAKAQAQLQLQAQLQQQATQLQQQASLLFPNAGLFLQRQTNPFLPNPNAALLGNPAFQLQHFAQQQQQHNLLAAQLQTVGSVAASLPQFSMMNSMAALAGQPVVVSTPTTIPNPSILLHNNSISALNANRAPLLSTNEQAQKFQQHVPPTTIAQQQLQQPPAVTQAGAQTVQTPHGELPVFPAPDVSKYQFEETSGFYYDPDTGLYYDANSQYYYNADTQKYVYWDAQYSTYLPAPESETETEKVQKKEKEEKVKVAKKIQKDMERWAKQQNKTKPSQQQSQPPETSNGQQQSGGKSSTTDVVFSILESQATRGRSKLVDYDDDQPSGSFAAPPPPPGTVSAAFTAPNIAQDVALSAADNASFNIHDDPKLTDWDKKACLLCKRRFPTTDALERHQKMSDLHKQYRDRAKERREKYGLDNEPAPNRMKEKFQGQGQPSFEQPTAKGIGADNIGNKLLKNMGWSEGQGLGRGNQGIVDPIQAQRRVQGAGLGAGGSVAPPEPTTGNHYKEHVKSVMRQKYYHDS